MLRSVLATSIDSVSYCFPVNAACLSVMSVSDSSTDATEIPAAFCNHVANELIMVCHQDPSSLLACNLQVWFYRVWLQVLAFLLSGSEVIPCVMS